jgi:hypothetical protein
MSATYGHVSINFEMTSSDENLTSRTDRLSGHLLQHRFEDVLPKLGQFIVLQVDKCL